MFAASVAIVALMLARGLPVRTHPLHRDQLVVPVASLSQSQFWELLERLDFQYLATVAFLSTTPGVDFTYTSDATWNNANNSVELIAAGGSGGYAQRGVAKGTGGGGGEYGATTNYSFATPGTTSVNCRVGLGGALAQGVIGSTAQTGAGNAGGDSWFNGASQAAATLGAIGGGAGAGVNGTTANGGAGGTGGVGTTHRAGGRGGNITQTTGNSQGTGGGGAGGPTAAGANGVDITTTTVNVGSNGGAADVGGSGAGTAGAGASGATPGGNGGNGTEWTTAGSGGGGGGVGFSLNGATVAGTAGNYGGGGGGDGNSSSGGAGSTRATSGAGANGIIVLTWTPSTGAVAKYLSVNQATTRASYW